MTDRGHRSVDHTADEIIEAWGPTRAACLEEAVRGLVGLFAAPRGDAPSDEHEIVLEGDDEAMLLAALDEVVFLADARSAVPAEVEAIDEGDRIRLRLRLVSTCDAEGIGPPPKAVSRGGLALLQDGDRWTARALIDL